jgi:hypothetical protein
LSIAARPAATLGKVGSAAYLNMLRVIASEASKLKPDTLRAMRASPCVLGLTKDDKGDSLGKLYLASDIVVEDDSRFRRLFPEVASAPLEALLEGLYKALGSSDISAVVEEISAPANNTVALPLSKDGCELDKKLALRLPVLVQKCPPNEVHGARFQAWDAKAKKKRQNKDFGTEPGAFVRQVAHISCELRLKLANRAVQSKTVQATCCFSGDRLCVTKVDYFHVASALVRLFLKVRSNDRALLWATLLQSSGESLEEMGFVLPNDPVVAVALPKLVAPEEPSSLAKSPSLVKPSVTLSAASNLPPSKPPPTALPSVLPKSLPEVLPKSLPDVLPKSLPDVLPKSLPSVLPKSLPSVLPKSLPSVLPRHRPNNPNPHPAPPLPLLPWVLQTRRRFATRPSQRRWASVGPRTRRRSATAASSSPSRRPCWTVRFHVISSFLSFHIQHHSGL